MSLDINSELSELRVQMWLSGLAVLNCHYDKATKIKILTEAINEAVGNDEIVPAMTGLDPFDNAVNNEILRLYERMRYLPKPYNPRQT